MDHVRHSNENDGRSNSHDARVDDGIGRLARYDTRKQPLSLTMSQTHRSGDEPTVLVVEDDRDLADTYSTWLEPECEVRTTYSGSDGLTWYDSSVDIVLLDRRIPDLSGMTVIQNMEKRDVDDQKAMLTGLEPGSELAELPCDEYLTKPVTKSELREAVRDLDARLELDDELQRHFRLISKIAALETSGASETADTIDGLRRKADQVRSRIENRVSDLDEPEKAYQLLD